jgi:hypothetical protein
MIRLSLHLTTIFLAAASASTSVLAEEEHDPGGPLDVGPDGDGSTFEKIVPGGEVIPLFFDSEGHPYVRFTLNGQPLKAFVSTATETYVSDKIIESRGPQFRGHFSHSEARSSFGARDGAVIEHMQLGKVSIDNLNVALLPSGSVADVVLGHAFFDKVDAVFLPDEGVVALFRGGLGSIAQAKPRELSILRELDGKALVPSVVPSRERGSVIDTSSPNSSRSVFGGDKFFGRRTLLSLSRGLMTQSTWPLRPPELLHGRNGETCGTKPCVALEVVRGAASVCLALTVDASWSGKRVAARAEVFADGSSAPIGDGAVLIEADVPAAGLSTCLDVADAFSEYGVHECDRVALDFFRVIDAPQLCNAPTCATFVGKR